MQGREADGAGRGAVGKGWHLQRLNDARPIVWAIWWALWWLNQSTHFARATHTHTHTERGKRVSYVMRRCIACIAVALGHPLISWLRLKFPCVTNYNNILSDRRKTIYRISIILILMNINNKIKVFHK